MRIIAQSGGCLQSEAAFRQWAGRIVRQVLIDYARRRNADIRDVKRRAELTGDEQERSGLSPQELLALSELLDQLARTHPRMASVVEMRFFAGMTNAAIAHRLGVCAGTVQNDWTTARAWLYGRMKS